MRFISRIRFQLIVLIVTILLAMVGASVWLLPENWYWKTERDEIVDRDGTRRLTTPKETERRLTMSDPIATVLWTKRDCRLYPTGRSGCTRRIAIITWTSLLYHTWMPDGRRHYLEDRGRIHYAFGSPGGELGRDLTRRFPLSLSDQDVKTWQPSGAFCYHFQRTAESARAGWDFELRVPFWLITSSMAAPAALIGGLYSLRWVNRNRRRAAKHCPACNYDLRASTDRCPECGHPIPAKPQPPAIAPRTNTPA
jgi:hypothetical protein